MSTAATDSKPEFGGGWVCQGNGHWTYPWHSWVCPSVGEPGRWEWHLQQTARHQGMWDATLKDYEGYADSQEAAERLARMAWQAVDAPIVVVEHP